MSRLSRLVDLANRPGTPAEGRLARAHARRYAARHGLEIVELPDGSLIVVEVWRADLMRALRRIANGQPEGRDVINDGRER